MSLGLTRSSPDAPGKLRPGLWMALLAAAGLAGWSLWTGTSPASQPMADANRALHASTAPRTAAGPAMPASSLATPATLWPASNSSNPSILALPQALEVAALGPAEHDPFVGTRPSPKQPPPSLPSAAMPPPPPPTAAIAPQVQTSPALNYRFLARISAPGGEVLTYLARGDQVIAVHAGVRLVEGYVVEAVDERAVRLHHPQLDVRALVAFAPSDAAPVRVGAP